MKIYTLKDRSGVAIDTETPSSEHSSAGIAEWTNGPNSVRQFITSSMSQRAAWLDRPQLGDRWIAQPAPLCPPIRDPSKILCVGRNYPQHAEETGAAVPAEPLIFSKLPTTLIGHGEEIHLPSESSQIDFEAELVVVIGTAGRHISSREALHHVAGYTCGNDVTARDWQKGKPGGQWLLGKSFDTFAPLGPCLVTADEVPDPQNLDIQLRLNGKVMQASNTSAMLFSVRQLISYISCVCTLVPGDLIFTGTPSGVGVARLPQVFLRPGDEVTVEIERIGCLTNRVM